ncbi:hypothetical protein [Altererythrobacter lauratis]|uniref:Uncharacterized protein n=1 Tax=Alteraurantiacibacter lauratis TaxID=2054627 RepID=A0ABV7EE74_9SPHN
MIARLLTPARLLLGAMLLAGGLNHFAGRFMPAPEGSTPLAIQLMEALHFSALIDVAMGMQMATGVAILVNRFAPLALAAVMPVNICGLYWALVLERSPVWSLFAGLAVALTALLMFALLHRYAAMLAPRALAFGESEGQRFETLYARPCGQTGGRDFALALLPLAGAAAFYHFIVPSVLGFWCLMVLLVPLAVLVLRGLQAMLVNPERER